MAWIYLLVWSGLGTAAIAVIGYMYFHESMTLLKAVSVTLIVIGIIGLNIDTYDKPIQQGGHE